MPRRFHCARFRTSHTGIFFCSLVALALFTIITSPSYAQIYFDKDGQLKGAKNSKCFTKLPYVTFTDSSEVSERSAKELKKWFQQRVESAIYFLSDTANKKQYDIIWGDTARTRVEKELTHLQNYLSYSAAASDSNIYLPTSMEIDTLTKKTLLHALADTTEQYDPMAFMARLLRYDPLKRFLFNRYQESISRNDPILDLVINYEYVIQWREIEDWYASVLTWQHEIAAMDSSLYYDIQHIKEIEKKLAQMDLKKNKVIQAIKSSLFLKRWTWMTDGVITITPLVAANATGQFPNGEPNRFLTTQMAKLLDSVHRSNRLKQFSTYTSLYNKALFPRDPRTKKEKSGRRSTAYLEVYDASQGYKKLTDDLDFIGDKDYLRVVTHNIDVDKTLKPAFSSKKIEEENDVTGSLNEGASMIGGLVGIIQPQIAAFSMLSSAINPYHFNSANGTIIEASANRHKIHQLLQSNPLALQNIAKDKMKFSCGEDSLFSPEDGGEVWSEFDPNPLAVVLKGNIAVPMTRKQTEDKRNILWVSDQKANYSFGNPNFRFARSIEVFLEFDKYIFLDYSSTELKASADSLMKRFDAFKKRLNGMQDSARTIMLAVQDKGKVLESYLRITNRSLPVRDLKPITDTTSPARRSEIFKPSKQEAFNELSLVVDESTEGSKEPPKNVIEQTLKVTKYRKFDVSIGLAFTVSPYETISQKGTAPPSTEVGDRLQFIAGVHWFVFGKINKLDSRVWGNWKERLSIFAGLGISYPLDNYFPAISYDWVPGLKTMVGAHLYRDWRFKVRNDLVVDKASAPTFGGFFFSVNLEPVTLAKLVGLLK